MGEGHR